MRLIHELYLIPQCVQSPTCNSMVHTLQWRHMSAMTSEITGNPIVCNSFFRLATYTSEFAITGSLQVESINCRFPSQKASNANNFSMGLSPDTQNYGLHMRRECRERFPRHRLPWKPLGSDPGMYHGTLVMHVPWCMLGSPTRGAGENVPGIPGGCTTNNFTYLVRGPWHEVVMKSPSYPGLLLSFLPFLDVLQLL